MWHQRLLVMHHQRHRRVIAQLMRRRVLMEPTSLNPGRINRRRWLAHRRRRLLRRGSVRRWQLLVLRRRQLMNQHQLMGRRRLAHGLRTGSIVWGRRGLVGPVCRRRLLVMHRRRLLRRQRLMHHRRVIAQLMRRRVLMEPTSLNPGRINRRR